MCLNVFVGLSILGYPGVDNFMERLRLRTSYLIILFGIYIYIYMYIYTVVAEL